MITKEEYIAIVYQICLAQNAMEQAADAYQEIKVVAHQLQDIYQFSKPQTLYLSIQQYTSGLIQQIQTYEQTFQIPSENRNLVKFVVALNKLISQQSGMTVNTYLQNNEIVVCQQFADLSQLAGTTINVENIGIVSVPNSINTLLVEENNNPLTDDNIPLML